MKNVLSTLFTFALMFFSHAVAFAENQTDSAQTTGGQIGLVDIVIIGLVVFLLIRVLLRKRNADNPDKPKYSPKLPTSRNDTTNIENLPPTGHQKPTDEGLANQERQARATWDYLSSHDNQQNASANPGQPATASFTPDNNDFLRGAKMLAGRYYEAWDTRDLEDLAPFITPAMHETLKLRAQYDPTPQTTELLLVDAKLISMKTEKGQEVATVQFDNLIRENSAKQPKNTHEIWVFMQPEDGSSTWRLDSITPA